MSITITEPGIYSGIPNDVYHSDPTAYGSLSSSGARKILDKTPAHFRYDQTHPHHTDAFDMGTAAHSVILEGDHAGIVVVDAANWMSKAAKEARDEAHAKGLTPLLSKDYAQVLAMAEQIKTHKEAMYLLRDGLPEQSAFWQHETGVWLRARFDWLPNHRGPGLLLADYKTSVSADRHKFAKSAADYGYHQQAAFYIDAAKALGLSKDPGMAFVVQEKTAPYLVNVIELDEEAIATGRALNEKAIRLFQQCKLTDTWPGYRMGEPVPLPKWAIYDADNKLGAQAA
jgi:hypothetical protein